MINTTNGITGIKDITAQLGTARSNTDSMGNTSEAGSFSEYLNNAIKKVNDFQIEAEALGNQLAAGKTDNIHQVMISGEKAEIALQFTMQIRNKVLDAYNEIMRMQI